MTIFHSNNNPNPPNRGLFFYVKVLKGVVYVNISCIFTSAIKLKTKKNVMKTSILKTRLQELNVNAFRITNRLGKLILTISYKDYQFIADTDIDQDLTIKINMI